MFVPAPSLNGFVTQADEKKEMYLETTCSLEYKDITN